MANSIKLKNNNYIDLRGIVIPTGIDWGGTNQAPVKCERYNNCNFNDLKDTGVFYCDGTPGSKGCSNYPENTTGCLIVLRMLVFSYQFFLCHTGMIYYRGHYNDSWSSWKSL